MPCVCCIKLREPHLNITYTHTYIQSLSSSCLSLLINYMLLSYHTSSLSSHIFIYLLFCPTYTYTYTS
ncbi:hypothetical protein L1887_17112 [Cichorium endivia]|nr:hypothetical protein L1887_17112 [Cichorium endivia]